MNEFAAWQWTGTEFESCATVPLSDRGFRYGMALFESLRVEGREPQFLPEHLEKLRAACAEREFPVDELPLTQVAELLRECGRDGFARIYITAGDGLGGGPPAQCRLYVFIEERPAVSLLAYDVGIAEDAHHPLFGGMKTANYWANLDALQTAQRAGRDESLLFNENGELISACTANVFLVHGGELRTPALACGARAGVIRGVLAEHVSVRESSLFLADVMAAEEMFLTNSWLGVMPVARVAGRDLPSRALGEKLRGELARGFRDR